MCAYESFKDLEIVDQEVEILGMIRETAFKACFSQTENPDLAGIVSDDFDLIVRSIISGTNDPWIAGIVDCYMHNEIPRGKIQLSSENIGEKFMRLAEEMGMA